MPARCGRLRRGCPCFFFADLRDNKSTRSHLCSLSERTMNLSSLDTIRVMTYATPLFSQKLSSILNTVTFPETDTEDRSHFLPPSRPPFLQRASDLIKSLIYLCLSVLPSVCAASAAPGSVRFAYARENLLLRPRREFRFLSHGICSPSEAGKRSRVARVSIPLCHTTPF